MSKKKEMYAPLTRWQYFTKTLYHDPSKTQEFEYDGVIYLKSQELQDIEERNARVNWVLLLVLCAMFLTAIKWQNIVVIAVGMVVIVAGELFRCGVEVGKDVTIAQLRQEGFRGFYVAVGLQSGGRLNIPGDDAQGVTAGIDFMRRVNGGQETKLEGRVVVIGGGNIAADVARTAVRCGAESVDLYCLESYDDMPMGPEDRGECERDGITIHAGWGQTEIVTENGHAAGIRFRKCLRVKNDQGRFAPEFDDNDTCQAQCAAVLYCIGQKVDWRQLLTGTAVTFNPNGI